MYDVGSGSMASNDSHWTQSMTTFIVRVMENGSTYYFWEVQQKIAAGSASTCIYSFSQRAMAIWIWSLQAATMSVYRIRLSRWIE